jgi:predicted 3-demethylubiquinone-9 3-methyltransferase (glyoxalase superfamily)
MTQRVATHLMFSGKAGQALEFYAATFPDFHVTAMERYGPSESGHAGWVKRADATFGEHRLIVIDSPVKHAFTFTAAMSLFVDCRDASELDQVFGVLSAGGQVFMPLGDYGFSRRFGWCADRYGVSWQLNLP